MYWDMSVSLSYNQLFNFIVGNRGAGKTYGSQKYVINKFLKTGEQFIYLRRYKQELKKISQFFKAVSSEFPETLFEVKGNKFYINEKLAGFSFPLSTSKIEKSTAFPEVTTIIFDEFIIDKGTYHYLADEVICFLEFYETVARTRENVKVYFLSNAITISNPYFLYFNITLPYNKNIKAKNDILIEMVANKDFISMKEKTRFGKLINGTDYASYSIHNEFLRDSNTFIEKKTGNCDFYMCFIYKNVKYGVWVNYSIGKMFVSYDVAPDFTIYTLTLADHKENTLLISSLRNSTLWKRFIEAYKQGALYFENQKIKNACQEVIKMILLR